MFFLDPLDDAECSRPHPYLEHKLSRKNSAFRRVLMTIGRHLFPKPQLRQMEHVTCLLTLTFLTHAHVHRDPGNAGTSQLLQTVDYQRYQHRFL